MVCGRVPRILDLTDGAPPRVSEEDAPGPPPAGTLRWIDVEAATPALLESLRVPFGLHQLAIEDCLTFEQRPKLEEYPEHLFIVIHHLELDDGELVGREIHAFLARDVLITVHSEPCQVLERARVRLTSDPNARARGIGFFYYLVADAIAAGNWNTLDALIGAIDELEDQILNQTSTAGLPRLFQLKRALSSARRLLSPQRDVFGALSRYDDETVSARAALYFRDAYDKVVRSNELIDANRELLSNVLDAHFSVVAQRTNEIMKRLTALSAIFLPLTFITGFFGQNFQALPFDSVTLTYVAVGSCLLLPPTMLLWFKSNRWI